MNNKDIIQRFVFENADIRGEMVRLDTSYQTIMSQHKYSHPIQCILGEMLAVSVLLSAIIKFQGRLSVQFQGKDPLKLLLAQCTNEFQLRGLAQCKHDISENELSDALKKGVLAIIVNPDISTARYQGMVAWQGDSVAHSLEGYFKHSEQLPTRIWLASNENSVTGLLLQKLPQEGSKKTSPVLEDSDWERIIYLTETITPDELLNLDNATILHRLYSQEVVRLFAPDAVNFACTCSLQRSENAILMLGKEEADAELQDKQKIVVTCEFCNKEYNFDRVDVETIFKKGGGAASLH